MEVSAKIKENGIMEGKRQPIPALPLTEKNKKEVVKMDDIYDMSSEEYKKFVEFIKRRFEPKTEEEMAENLRKIKEGIRSLNQK